MSIHFHSISAAQFHPADLSYEANFIDVCAPTLYDLFCSSPVSLSHSYGLTLDVRVYQPCRLVVAHTNLLVQPDKVQKLPVFVRNTRQIYLHVLANLPILHRLILIL